MARRNVGALVGMVGGEWIERAGVCEPVYGVVLQVRERDGSCLVRFSDGLKGWLRSSDLEDISEGGCIGGGG